MYKRMKNIIKIMSELMGNKFRVIITILFLLVLVALKVSIKIIINKRFIANYPEANQQIRLELISIMNFYEPYIAPYNYGNYYYQKKKYNKAYEKYTEALKYNIPKKRECSVRINIGMTLMKLSEINAEEKNKLLHEAWEHLKKCVGLEIDEEEFDDADELASQQQKASKIIDDINEETGSDSSGDDGLQGGGGSPVDGGTQDGNGSISDIPKNGNGGMFGIDSPQESSGVVKNNRAKKDETHTRESALEEDELCKNCW